MRGGQLRGWLADGEHSYIAGVAELFVLMGARDPQWTLSNMESDICESMDPQSRFGNFAIMGPFVCLARFLSRSRGHLT